MSTTTKSPKKVVRTALRVAARVLPLYSHHMSPKKFSQPQLFACLVLKTFFKTDYRGICAYLTDMPDLRRAIGLKDVPHFTTLHKASQCLLAVNACKNLLHSTLWGLKHLLPLAAVDATGLQSGHISPYFYNVREKASKKLVWTHFTQYPKFAAVADIATHMIISFLATRGPTRDSTHFKTILDSLPQDIKVEHILADAGYDKEDNHIYAREILGILTTIPPTSGSPPKNLPRKYYRRLMKLNFDTTAYKQRWQIETVFSMIKRNLGYTVRARVQTNQSTEMFLMAITHNILIILFLFFQRAFLQSTIFNLRIRMRINTLLRPSGYEGQAVFLTCRFCF
jgi:transposase